MMIVSVGSLQSRKVATCFNHRRSKRMNNDLDFSWKRSTSPVCEKSGHCKSNDLLKVKQFPLKDSGTRDSAQG